ncbi:MAG TPA: DUF3488 and transglutaminase-like domain-containing protein, partial [Acidimicrobiales bacterium]|nr:DUF3488 and transglutaminase-like domain-containing protein [Acidimicrobiales bacterium]
MLTAPERPKLTPSDGGRVRGQASPAPAPRNVVNGGDPAATAALAFLTLASAWGLFRVFAGHRWIGPVLGTALAVHAVCWAARRGRLPGAVAAPLELAVVAVVGIWTVIGSTTVYGVPTSASFNTAYHSLQTAYRDIPSVVAPVQPTKGFVLAAALGAGLVAFAGDWLAFRVRSALWAAVPAFAMFLTCCVVGYGPGRQWAAIIEAAALLMFFLLHRSSEAGAGVPWLGGNAAGAATWALPAGAIIAGVAMLVVLVIAPASKGVEGSGLLGWRAGSAGSGGPRQVANPIVDLRTRLVDLSNVGVFTVHSPVASYWRLTSLDTFTGVAWVSTNSYRGFGSRLPGVAAVPPGTRTVQEQFRVQGLESVWLPAAFTPVSVVGVKSVGYDSTSSSLITSRKTSDGLNYTVTSYQYLSTLDPSQLESAPSVSTDASVSRYLSLPVTVPQSVYALARQVTAGKQSEYAKALALQDFFLGPSFQYSLNPPFDGYGIDALTSFLFNTRTGYCQQFAGAYAVLARAVGLPTRLAVGFATGRDTGGGTYQVVDADAHTWPEVYFGPKIGWVPFEPTKSFSDPTAQGYAPPLASSGPSTGAIGAPAAPAPHSTTPTTAAGGAARTSPTTAAAAATHAGTSSGIGGGLAAALVVFGLIVAWVA